MLKKIISISLLSCVSLSAIDKKDIAIYSTAAAIVTWSAIHGAKALDLYRTNRELQDDKKTWGLSKEIFPSFYEIKNAQEDAIGIILADIKTFRDEYSTDPYCLINFVRETQRDINILDSYTKELKGEGRLNELRVGAKNKVAYFFIQGWIKEVLEEVLRYRKHLSFIRKLVIDSSDYKAQLKLSAK